MEHIPVKLQAHSLQTVTLPQTSPQIFFEVFPET